MKSQLLHNHCYAASPVSKEVGPALTALQQLLSGQYADKAEAWGLLANELQSEGLLPYFAYRLLQPGVELAGPFRQLLRRELLQRDAEKLSDDGELARIFHAAKQNSIPMLVFKGEALARSLYPSAACRPTGDYDILVQPEDLVSAQGVFETLGYRAEDIKGKHILAQQNWICPAQVRGRTFQVDLHWDVSNQRFFRRRVSLPALWRDAQAIAVTDGQIIAPSHAHALLIACTHLAADLPGTAIQLKWLLDIHLLLEALSTEQMQALVEQARAWGLLDVLVFYCRLTEGSISPSRHARQFERLAKNKSRLQSQCYRWAIDHRWFDLLEYGIRLPGLAMRRAYLKEIINYRKQRNAQRQQRAS